MNKRAREKQKEILESRYEEYRRRLAAYHEQPFDSPQRIVGVMFLRTERKSLREEFTALGLQVPFDLKELGDTKA